MPIDRKGLPGSFKLEKEGRKFEREVFGLVNINHPKYKEAQASVESEKQHIAAEVRKEKNIPNERAETIKRWIDLAVKRLILDIPEAQPYNPTHPYDSKNTKLYEVGRYVLEELRDLLAEKKMLEGDKEEDIDRVQFYSAVGTLLDGYGIDGLVAFTDKENKIHYVTIDAKTIDPALREKHPATDMYLEQAKVYKTVYVMKDKDGRVLKNKDGEDREVPEKEVVFLSKEEKEDSRKFVINDDEMRRYAETIFRLMFPKE